MVVIYFSSFLASKIKKELKATKHCFSTICSLRNLYKYKCAQCAPHFAFVRHGLCAAFVYFFSLLFFSSLLIISRCSCIAFGIILLDSRQLCHLVAFNSSSNRTWSRRRENERSIKKILAITVFFPSWSFFPVSQLDEYCIQFYLKMLCKFEHKIERPNEKKQIPNKFTSISGIIHTMFMYFRLDVVIAKHFSQLIVNTFSPIYRLHRVSI